MSLADIVNSTTTSTTVNPTRPGFGVPLIASYNTHGGPLVQFFTSLPSMVTAGFTTTEPTYLAASKIASQTPAPPTWAVGRRVNAPLQTIKLTCTDAVGDVGSNKSYSMNLVSTFDGVVHSISIASTGVPATDAATINTAITAFAMAGCTATNASGVITLTQTAGHMLDVNNRSAFITLQDTTADPGLTADLTAIAAYNGTGWYALCLDSNSAAEIASACAWCDSNNKLGSFNNSDSINWNGASTTDIFYTQKALSVGRAYIQHAETQLLCFSGAAMLGSRLPANPGSDTWDLKTLVGVPADVLTETQTLAITAKSGNFYTTIAGINVSNNGLCPGGEYVDVVRFIDWLNSNIQIDVFSLLIAYPKVPFTNIGITMVTNAVKNRIKIGGSSAYGGIDLTQPYSVQSLYTANTIDTADKNNRNLPSVTWSARLAGAIQTVTVSGTLY